MAPTSIQLALAMLESGEAKSWKEIATREGIDDSYVSRVVNLTQQPGFTQQLLQARLTLHRAVQRFLQHLMTDANQCGTVRIQTQNGVNRSSLTPSCR